MSEDERKLRNNENMDLRKMTLLYDDAKGIPANTHANKCSNAKSSVESALDRMGRRNR